MVSANAENILRKITKTGMRNFMLGNRNRKDHDGPDHRKMPRASLLLFLLWRTESDLISSYIPNTGKRILETGIKADWKAFMMDPAGVLMELTGNYEEGLEMGGV